jgi:preprotein translocase subunit SecG
MTETSHEPAPPGGTPRWVKVFGIILAVLVLAFVIVLLVQGGHGPGRHFSVGADVRQIHLEDSSAA